MLTVGDLGNPRKFGGRLRTRDRELKPRRSLLGNTRFAGVLSLLEMPNLTLGARDGVELSGLLQLGRRGFFALGSGFRCTRSHGFGLLGELVQLEQERLLLRLENRVG